MLVRFDRSSLLTVDQKLQSLVDSIHIALNEITNDQAELKKSVEDIKKALEELSNN